MLCSMFDELMRFDGVPGAVAEMDRGMLQDVGTYVEEGERGIAFLLPSTLGSVSGFTRCPKVGTWGFRAARFCG